MERKNELQEEEWRHQEEMRRKKHLFMQATTDAIQGLSKAGYGPTTRPGGTPAGIPEYVEQIEREQYISSPESKAEASLKRMQTQLEEALGEIRQQRLENTLRELRSDYVTLVTDRTGLARDKISPATLASIKRALAGIERGDPRLDALEKVRNQLQGGLLNHVKGEVAEQLCNQGMMLEKLLSIDLELPDNTTTEAFLSGEFRDRDGLIMDRFIAHRQDDHLVIDAVIEVKGYAAPLTNVREQLERHISRLSDGEIKIDGHPVKVRISDHVRRLAVAPAEVQEADLNLIATSQEIEEGTTDAVRSALLECFSQSQLDDLFRHLTLREVIRPEQMQRFGRTLMGPGRWTRIVPQGTPGVG